MIKKFTTPANLPAFSVGLLILLIPVLFAFSTHAQQFDWVHGGGSTQSDATLQTNAEATYFTTTDAHGNIYALSLVGNTSITADTFYATAAYGVDQNLLITSYTCAGQMRWAKLIASTVTTCKPYGIIADSLGHVYVAGLMPTNGGTIHIGYDTSLSGAANEYRYNGLIQYDTSGHFDWIQYVGGNTINTLEGTLSFGSALVIDGDNNVHFINNMKSGVTIMTGVTSQYGDYDLTYNTSGTLLSAKRLGMDSVWYINNATIDAATGKLYASGQRNQGLVTTFCTYAAAFDTGRNVVWMDTVGNNELSLNSVVYDKIGHLYFGAGSQGAFVFNGHSASAGDKSIIIKTDTSGNVFWIDQAFGTTSAVGIAQITLLPNNLLVGAGICGGTLTDGTNTIVTLAAEGQNPYLTVLDTSGVVMTFEQIHGDGEYDWGRSITSDRVGNVYVGGRVEDSIWALNSSVAIPAYHSIGGNSDFFVMKYGMDCGCTSMPVADFSVTGPDTAHTRNFTYDGTTANVDSMVWSVNDTAVFAHGSTTTRTFDTGSYEICITVYTPCGNDMHCSRIVVTDSSHVGINNISVDNIQVYPNPSQNELTVSNAETGSSLIITNIVGQQVFNAVINSAKQTIDVSALPDGSYILQVTKNDGSRFVQKFVIAR